jgi:hypothetical protein
MAQMSYITTEELASRLHYNPRYIRDFLVDTVLLEGIHYLRPFGRRRILFIWDVIEKDMFNKTANTQEFTIPLVRGGVCNG